MAKAKAKTSADTAANLGFEAKLWLTADKLRNNMDGDVGPAQQRQEASANGITTQ